MNGDRGYRSVLRGCVAFLAKRRVHVQQLVSNLRGERAQTKAVELQNAGALVDRFSNRRCTPRALAAVLHHRAHQANHVNENHHSKFRTALLFDALRFAWQARPASTCFMLTQWFARFARVPPATPRTKVTLAPPALVTKLPICGLKFLTLYGIAAVGEEFWAGGVFLRSSHRAAGGNWAFINDTASAIFFGMSAASATEVYAVGGQGSVLKHFEGSSWSVVPAMGSVSLGRTLCVVSPALIYVGGSNGNTPAIDRFIRP